MIFPLVSHTIRCPRKYSECCHYVLLLICTLASTTPIASSVHVGDRNHDYRQDKIAAFHNRRREVSAYNRVETVELTCLLASLDSAKEHRKEERKETNTTPCAVVCRKVPTLPTLL
jgi:hypothetical protein